MILLKKEKYTLIKRNFNTKAILGMSTNTSIKIRLSSKESEK